MKVLAFDTSLDKTYIAISDGYSAAFEQIKSDEKNYHSAYLVPKIKELSEKTGVEIDSLDAIVTNAGPGSFTGIRAGLSVAKIMALELNLPVVPLNSCEILKTASNIDNAVVLLDARRMMYYFYNGSKIELILKDDVISKIADSKVICDTNVKKDYLNVCANEFINYEEQNYPLAQIIMSLGLKKLYASKNIAQDFPPDKLKANYIQTPPVFNR